MGDELSLQAQLKEVAGYKKIKILCYQNRAHKALEVDMFTGPALVL